jgi:hypothetical protein
VGSKEQGAMQETLNTKLNMQFDDTPPNHGDISMAGSVW